MIDLLIKLVESLHKLLDHKQTKALTYFHEYVQPTYDAAELVFKDYLKLFNDVKRMVEADQNSKEIIRFLEDRRGDHLPERAKLRELTFRKIKNTKANNYYQDLLRLAYPVGDKQISSELNRFESGIILLLRGGVTHLESSPPSFLSGSGSHAILDVLKYFEKRSGQDWNRNEYILLVEKQVGALMRAWEEVVSGYVELHEKAIPRI
jgi:hypothetical protein